MPNLHYFYPDYFNLIVNKPVDYISYDKLPGGWTYFSKGTYYYSTNPSSVSNVTYKGCTVHPNPASKYITFDISTPLSDTKVDIFTIQGKKMLSQPLYNNTVDVRKLPSGMYLFQLNVEGKISNGKIMIK